MVDKRIDSRIFEFDMHWKLTRTHTRTLQEVNNNNNNNKREKNYTTGIRNNEKKSQRIHVSAEAQNITHEVKLQVQ